MAGLFDIFSESENSNSLHLKKGKEKSHTLAFSKLKTAENVGFTSNKIFTQPQSKPKGLSIRSKSDLNVSVSNNSGLNKLTSKDCMNILDKQCFLNKQALSPLKMKTPKSKSFANITAKKLSPKISSPIMQNVIDEFIFTKPATPKQSKMSNCPEPETLAHYFDPSKYMKEEMESIFNEDRMLFKSVEKCDDSIISLEDEGFISDPENESFQINEISLPSVIDIELPSLSDVELAEISDYED